MAKTKLLKGEEQLQMQKVSEEEFYLQIKLQLMVKKSVRAYVNGSYDYRKEKKAVLANVIQGATPKNAYITIMSVYEKEYTNKFNQKSTAKVVSALYLGEIYTFLLSELSRKRGLFVLN